MAQERFIAASSLDAGEVATDVSPSSSAGPIRHRRSLDPPVVVPLSRFEDFPILPQARLPMRSYLGVQQRRWEDVGHRDYRSRDPHPPVAR